MDYKTLTFEQIIEWCKANNQVEWLKKEMAKTTIAKTHPRITVDGKKVLDKSVTIEKEIPITFVQIKNDFRKEFLKDEMPVKPKKPTMRDIVDSL